MCLSTTYPGCKWRSLSDLKNRRSSLDPSSLTMYLAPVSPGGGCGPFSTSLRIFSMLCGVTTSGNVKLSAIAHGTPSSSSARFGSPVMTVRAEKSTRFPIRFPRTRPSFPLSLCAIDLIGLPLRCVADGSPGSELSMYPVTCIWRSRQNSAMMCCGAPPSSCFCSRMLALMISLSWCVRSSSDLALASIATLGRTGGGGTGNTVRIIHSGRENAGLNPSATQSSSLIPLRILSASSGVSSCFPSNASSPPVSCCAALASE